MSEVDQFGLPGGAFRVWRWVCVRAAGFPASRALELAAEDAAAAADEVLGAEDAVRICEERARAAVDAALPNAERAAEVQLHKAQKAIGKNVPLPVTGTAADAPLGDLREAYARAAAALAAYHATFEPARRRVFEAAQRIAADPLFREAVTWQNRAAMSTGVARLIEADAGLRRSKERQHEVLVASHFFRYTTKNDTIGFFGPVAWARLEPSAAPMVIKPGPALLSQRRVYFEQWPIDALAAQLTADERFLSWQPPERFGFVHLSEDAVESPLLGRKTLPPAQHAVLLACDGERSAARLASELTTARPELFPDEATFYGSLRELRDKKLVSWTFLSRTTQKPELDLRHRIDRIEDAALRAEALSPLETLEKARKVVADAAGDAERLGEALGALETTFTELTGTAATRNAGLTYAGRGLVFEDCQRDLDFVLGPKILEEIGPALSLVLMSSRWLSAAAADAYRKAFRELYASIAARAKSPVVPFATFYFRAQRLLHGTTGRPIDGVTTELRRRWGEILRVDPRASRQDFESASLKAAVHEAFHADRPGWQLAKHHSPDVMISASSPEAIARGEYVAVLGEVHASLNTLAASLWREQHPKPDELDALLAADLPEPRVVTIDSKGSRGDSGRAQDLRLPTDYVLEAGLEMSGMPRDRSLRVAELLLDDVDGTLVVRDREGRVRFDVVELMGMPLALATVNAFDMLPDMDHGPRVTIDRLVVRRERWKLSASDMGFASIDSEPERFLAARRFARARGLPRQVFLKSSSEVKPMYLDFASPVSIKLAGRTVRPAAEDAGATVSVSASEMLPTLDQTWLPDARGNRYACELRFVAVDAAGR